MLYGLRGLALGLLVSLATSAFPAERVMSVWHLAPFWESDTMHGESLFFLEPEAGVPATAPLLFTPLEVLSIVHPPTGTTYEEGRDYVIDTENKRITLTKDSRIPFTTRKDFEPPIGGSGQLYKDETRDIFFGAGPYFHNLQVEITYTHASHAWAAMKGPQPEATAHLPRTTAILQSGKPLALCLLGDSISTGLDASSTSNTAPHTPGYGTLVAHGLEEVFGSNVTFTNFSVSGMAAPWGVEQAPAVAAKKPDLVLIAFGMNDASSRRAPETFRADIEAIMAGIRSAHPETEFLLVATMRGNPDWKHTASELYPQYRDALVTLEKPGVTVADLTAFWTTLLKHKQFVDITGNGVNHPNDFGHRVYAQVILTRLGTSPTE